MDKRVALVGSGNAFFKDEGVGLYAAKYIKENYSFTPEVEIVDGGTLGLHLMTLLQEYKHVIIMNTSSEDNKESGEISVTRGEEFLDGALVKKTANEVEIAEMLQVCSLSEAVAQTIVISIVPEDVISVEVGLSETLKSQWDAYIETTLQNIEALDIRVEKKEQGLMQEDVLSLFADPSVEFKRGF